MTTRRKSSVFFSGFNPKYIRERESAQESTMVAVEEEGEEEAESESWMSLFLDLLYVAMFAKLSHLISACRSDMTLNFLAFVCVNMFFFSRYFIDEYAVRFFHDDIFHRIVYFIYMGGILVMVLNTDLDKHSIDGVYSCKLNQTFHIGFATGFGVTRMSIVALYLWLMYLDKTGKARTQFWLQTVILTAASIAFICCSLFIKDPSNMPYSYFTISAVETVMPFFIAFLLQCQYDGWIPRILTYDFPMNFLIEQDRLGVFILIVLGESLITLITPSWDQERILDINWVGLFGLLLLFLFAMKYYDDVRMDDVLHHAYGRNMFAGISFAVLHSLIGFFLLAMAQGIISVSSMTGYKTAESHDSSTGSTSSAEGGGDTTAHVVSMAASSSTASADFVNGRITYLSYGCAFAYFFMTLASLTHRGLAHHLTQKIELFHLAVDLVIFLAHLFVLYSRLNHENNLVLHCLIAIVSVLMDILVEKMVEKKLDIPHYCLDIVENQKIAASLDHDHDPNYSVNVATAQAQAQADVEAGVPPSGNENALEASNVLSTPRTEGGKKKRGLVRTFSQRTSPVQSPASLRGGAIVKPRAGTMSLKVLFAGKISPENIGPLHPSACSDKPPSPHKQPVPAAAAPATTLTPAEWRAISKDLQSLDIEGGRGASGIDIININNNNSHSNDNSGVFSPSQVDTSVDSSPSPDQMATSLAMSLKLTSIREEEAFASPQALKKLSGVYLHDDPSDQSSAVN